MSAKIERAAKAAANESELPVVANKRLRVAWGVAIAAAPWPWPGVAGSAEPRFREAFARELVRRGIAREEGANSGRSGKHTQPQMVIRADAEEIAGFKDAAKSAGKTLAAWILDSLRGRLA